MNSEMLWAQRCAIDSALEVVVATLQSTLPRPVEAACALVILARLIRDHCVLATPVIQATLAATRPTRHADAAAVSAETLDLLRAEWAGFRTRWTEKAIAVDWAGFVERSRAILPHLRQRTARETLVLYSLADHHGLLT